MILVSTTTCAAFMDTEDTWGAWLYGAEELRDQSPEPVEFFAALEVDGRGSAPLYPLIERLRGLGGDYWTFTYDDGRDEVTTENRLAHITAGQNMQIEYAMRKPDCTHILFLAADLQPPPDAITRLLEPGVRVIGGHVPTYCLPGRALTHNLYEHKVATAAFLMVERSMFARVRWRYDPDEGMSDDPCYCADVRARGGRVIVHRGVIGKHHPEQIGPVELRGHDMRVVR